MRTLLLAAAFPAVVVPLTAAAQVSVNINVPGVIAVAPPAPLPTTTACFLTLKPPPTRSGRGTAASPR